jgi:hypothetical protein
MKVQHIMIETNYEGYLTEDKLMKVLSDIFNQDFYSIRREVRALPTKRRFDFLIDVIDNLGNTKPLYHIEFDGDQHYRDTMVILSDIVKEEIASNMGYRTIRIPFWVQLTNETFKYWFHDIGFNVNISQNFKHGFWETKKFPASFCSIGLNRYINELNILPEEVATQTNDSISKALTLYDKKYVI